MAVVTPVLSSSAVAGVVVAVLVLALLGAVRAVVDRRRGWRLAVRARLHDPRRAGTRRTAEHRARLVAPAPAQLLSALEAAGVDVAPDVVVTWSAAVAAGTALVGVLAGGVVVGVLLPALLAAGGAGALVTLRGRGERRYATALPLGLDLVARSLRTGASLHQAIDEAGRATPGPVGADLVTIAGECRLGRPLVDAVEAWAERRPLPSVRLAVAALCLGAETGGAQARAVDGVAATLREHVALQGEVRALTSQARTSALVIAVAPIVFSAAMVFVDAGSAEFLLRTPIGLTLLAAGLALDALSAAWMHRLTARVAA